MPVEDPQWRALDPAQRRQRTLTAVQRLFVREAQVQPVLVILEDLHWIDTETQAFLDRLAENMAKAPLLLLVSYRPEYQHRWGGQTHYTELRLDPLAPASADELLDALLGRDASLESLKHLLAGTTGRNPLFIEESVRTLVETQGLAGELGAYRLARPVDTIQVPATVQAILAARIDRLSADDKRLLETAAVIGKDVPFAVLQAIAEEEDAALRRGLGSSSDGRVSLRDAPGPRARVHVQARADARGGLRQCAAGSPARLHARIVEAIEALYPVASASTPNGSPIMPSGASCGRRR